SCCEFLYSFCTSTCCLSSFFFQCFGAHPVLHSFPTRRSSDLRNPPAFCVSRSAPAAFCSAACGIVCSNSARHFSEITPPATLHRSEEHTSELQSPYDLVCRLLLEKKKTNKIYKHLHNIELELK